MLVREALYETVMAAGLACVSEVLEAERSGLCGARYQHLAERQAVRAGHVASSLVLGGRRVAGRASRLPWIALTMSGGHFAEARLMLAQARINPTSLIEGGRPLRIDFDFGTTVSAGSIRQHALSEAGTFPANFASNTFPDADSVASKCTTNPSESDTYGIYCDTTADAGACAGTHMGDVVLDTNCSATFTTLSGAVKTCAAGNTVRICAPSTVSGGGIAFTLAGHTTQ